MSWHSEVFAADVAEYEQRIDSDGRGPDPTLLGQLEEVLTKLTHDEEMMDAVERYRDWCADDALQPSDFDWELQAIDDIDTDTAHRLCVIWNNFHQETALLRGQATNVHIPFPLTDLAKPYKIDGRVQDDMEYWHHRGKPA